MLSYDFMRKALLVGFLLGVIIPLMGVVVVNRRTSTVGDALSHSSLAGIGMGLLLGFSPLIGATLACVIGALSIEAVRRRFPGSGDMATAIVMSAGIGLASILTDFVPTAIRLESFLFGSIVAIADYEVLLSIAIALIVLFVFFYMYYQLLYISTDPVGASISGISVERTDFVFTILLAVTIAISCRIIGALMVSSLMVLPVACARTFCRGYGKTVLAAMILGVTFVMAGLTVSWHLSLKPGGSIVMIGVFTLCIFLLLKPLFARRASNA